MEKKVSGYRSLPFLLLQFQAEFEVVILPQDQSFGGFGYAKYGEPGNFGTGYWGRKSLD